ncbi:tRNA (adenosine(37)-N6)-threonylcarbamoyltransferase complex dimerization subunit type 1 TsaB [Candidatus Dependentiae bacterium]
MENNYFLSIQGSYSELEISLYNNQTCLQSIKDKNKRASSLLIPYIQELLNKNKIQFCDLRFICSDQGPGAFTSLRVTISTLNGLAFKNNIPLIGIDGLDALSFETINKFNAQKTKNVLCPNIMVSLLNAFNGEVYFSISQINNIEILTHNKLCESKGYKKIKLLLEDLRTKSAKETILFSGNGTILNIDLIKNIFNDKAIIFDQAICSAKQIAKMALKKWNNKQDLSFKIYPLYLKTQTFAVKTVPILPCQTSNQAQS